MMKVSSILWIFEPKTYFDRKKKMLFLLIFFRQIGADERNETREASRSTLAKVLAFYPNGAAFKSVIQTHLCEQKRLNYVEFLKDFAKITYEPVADMYPAYVEKAMSYFHIGDARLRANAVYLITTLLVEGSHSTSSYGQNYAETIGNAIVKLLSDSSSEVQSAAAINLGKVCIAISHPNQPRLSIARSEDSTN